MNTKLIKTLSIGVMVVLFVGILAFIFPAGTVSASAEAQTPPPPVKESKPTDLVQQALKPEKLEKVFTAEQKMLERQGNLFDKFDKGITKVEAAIAKLKEKGKDPARLEALLAKFKEQYGKARSAHDKAAGILKTHAGFDSAGKMTDAGQAKTTVKDAGASLREARQILGRMLLEIRRVFLKFHGKANNP